MKTGKTKYDEIKLSIEKGRRIKIKKGDSVEIIEEHKNTYRVRFLKGSNKGMHLTCNKEVIELD